jgi:hypothetical protein
MDLMDRTGGIEAASRFLRLSLSSRWEPAALEAARAVAARDHVDWHKLLQLAREGALTPLLYHATRDRDLLPAHVEDDLRLDYFRTARRNALLFHELERALCRLAQDHLPTTLLKGAALAQVVYGNVALRPMFDLDLLVHREDVPAALRALRDLGYIPTAPETRPGDTLIYENELMLVKRGDVDTWLEVHWSLFNSPHYQNALPVDWLWRNTLPSDIGQTPARVLASEAQLLHLCGHLLLHHGCGSELQPLWLYDVAALIWCDAERLDWEEVLIRARSYDLVLSLQRVVPRAVEKWNAPVPVAVLERIHTLRPSREEARVVARLTARRRPVAQRFVADLASITGWRARVRYWRNNMIPSAAYMRERYAIPRRLLVPLYYPYRWLRGLWGAIFHRR